MGILNEADMSILPMINKGRLDIATSWYLQGFEPLWYQFAWHYAPQKATSFIAGIAAGKTATSAASVLMQCLAIPYYRALHTSVTAKQAELAFDMANGWIEDNPRLVHLIKNISLRPYPVIEFQNYAQWDFRTAGIDARYIRGSEYDRIVMDEAGLDPHGEVIKVLRGRLRGTRPYSPTGSARVPREARLDVITSPTDAPWLSERFYKGWKDNSQAELDKYFSIRATTYDNTYLLPEQIAMMESELTEEDVAVEMMGEFPDYGMSFFPKRHLDAITDTGRYLYDEVYNAVNPESGASKPNYDITEHPRHGITRYEKPFDPNAYYIMAGDPGQDDPPKRNAGVIFVADIAKKPFEIVFFHWVSGHGKYDPFLTSYKYAIEKYNPKYRGIDSTAGQKGIQELAFERNDIETDGISFGGKKDAMLNSLSLLVSNQEIVWPPIKGLIKQMSVYTKQDDSKLAQDIVMTLAMLASFCRYSPVANFNKEREEISFAIAQRISRRNRTSRLSSNRRFKR